LAAAKVVAGVLLAVVELLDPDPQLVRTSRPRDKQAFRTRLLRVSRIDDRRVVIEAATRYGLSSVAI
jgi:hypothetical protein